MQIQFEFTTKADLAKQIGYLTQLMGADTTAAEYEETQPKAAKTKKTAKSDDHFDDVDHEETTFEDVDHEETTFEDVDAEEESPSVADTIKALNKYAKTKGPNAALSLVKKLKIKEVKLATPKQCQQIMDALDA